MVHEIEILKKQGFIKEWGVSNFEAIHLQQLIEKGFIPALNQIEYHPFFQRLKLLAFCKQQDILVQAYRPLAKGRVFENPTLQSIAARHTTSTATLVYSWLAQQAIAIVTKVSSLEHQREYAESGKIHLSDEEMQEIAAINYPEETGRSCTTGGWFVPFDEEVAMKWKEAVI